MSARDSALRLVAGLPGPGTGAISHLRHTLAVAADRSDDDFVVVVTENVYGSGVRTGLTWGDLRYLTEVVLLGSWDVQ